VTKLRRVQIGHLTDQGLAPGEHRELTPREVAKFFEPASKPATRSDRRPARRPAKRPADRLANREAAKTRRQRLRPGVRAKPAKTG
ncbi:MAG TPA: hypothetical protein VJQ56_07560, partial [Blastocatellia bacterium]|nr:hypothetical protein [Blastocatellia bacterium]